MVDAARAEAGRTLSGHRGPVWSVAVSDGGQWVASGSHDGTLRLWQGRRASSCLRTEGPVLAVRFAPDDRHVLAAVRGGGFVRLEHATLPAGS